AGAEAAACRVEPGPDDGGAQVLLPLPRRGGAARPLPLRTPKKRDVLPDTLTIGELERLLSQPGRDELWERHFPGKPERDRLLLALMAYAGMRRSELLGLEWDDVDRSRRLLRVRKAKGGLQRTIPIHPALAPLCG